MKLLCLVTLLLLSFLTTKRTNLKTKEWESCRLFIKGISYRCGHQYKDGKLHVSAEIEKKHRERFIKFFSQTINGITNLKFDHDQTFWLDFNKIVHARLQGDKVMLFHHSGKSISLELPSAKILENNINLNLITSYLFQIATPEFYKNNPQEKAIVPKSKDSYYAAAVLPEPKKKFIEIVLNKKMPSGEYKCNYKTERLERFEAENVEVICIPLDKLLKDGGEVSNSLGQFKFELDGTKFIYINVVQDKDKFVKKILGYKVIE